MLWTLTWNAGLIKNGIAKTQLSNTRFLLCADTAFSYHPPSCPDGQQQHRRYPNLARTDPTSHNSRWPSEMVERPFYRHIEAQDLTKAILGRHEMPDATYYELEILGASFVCERCEDKGPKTWDGTVSRLLLFQYNA